MRKIMVLAIFLFVMTVGMPQGTSAQITRVEYQNIEVHEGEGESYSLEVVQGVQFNFNENLVILEPIKNIVGKTVIKILPYSYIIRDGFVSMTGIDGHDNIIFMDVWKGYYRMELRTKGNDLHKQDLMILKGL